MSSWYGQSDRERLDLEKLGVLKQGTTHPMCSAGVEGWRFRCQKFHDCPMKFIVLNGFVYALEPDRPIYPAHRGRDHMLQHRPGTRYHDYWCELKPDGRVSGDFVSQQCQHQEALLRKELDGITCLVNAFTIGAERLLSLLPRFQGVTMQLKSDPQLSVPLPNSSVNLPYRFDLDTFLEVFQRPRENACYIKREVLQEVRWLCEMLRFLRAIHHLVRQKLGGKGLGMILSLLGSASYLPRPRKISFAFEEVETPEPVLGSAQPPEPEDHEVIQAIEHQEPAAEREAALTAIQSDQDWADQVAAQILANGQDTPQENTNMSSIEKVYLLQYNRHSERFRQALTTGTLLQSSRHALETAGFQWLQPSGAKVFVHPWQFEGVMASIQQQKIELRPYHVIVSESLEYYLEASLHDVPCRDGARVKARQLLEPAGYSQEEQPPSAADDGVAADLVATRTFLCSVRRLRASNSVTQSTTEAHGGLNPRRLQPESVSEG